jgi:hypothetical protein
LNVRGRTTFVSWDKRGSNPLYHPNF